MASDRIRKDSNSFFSSFDCYCERIVDLEWWQPYCYHEYKHSQHVDVGVGLQKRAWLFLGVIDLLNHVTL